MRAVLAGTILVGLALAGLLWVWPWLAASRELLDAAAWRDAGISARRIGLLWRALWVSAASGALATLLGAALATGIADRARVVSQITCWAAVTVILTPPYIYAYGWSLLFFPQGVVNAAVPGAWWGLFATTGRAILCLATWLSPAAAWIVLSGWRSDGRRGYEAARVDAGPLRAMLLGAGPAMRGWLLLAAGATALLAFNEDNVCSLCLVPTLNTELVATLQSVTTPGRGLAMAWPSICVGALLLGWLWLQRARVAAAMAGDATSRLDLDIGALAGERAWPGRRVAPLLALAVLAAPGIAAVASIRSARALTTTWIAFATELGDSLSSGLVSGALAAALGLVFDYAWSRRRGGAIRRAAVALAAAGVLWALLPAALLGDALAASWARLPGVGDHWLMVAVTTAARFGMLAVALAAGVGAPGSELMERAQADGASPEQAYLRVRLWERRPAITASFLIVTMLSLTEVSATCLTRPSGVGSIALRMLNEIHFGRNDEVLAMCGYLSALAGVAAAAVTRFGAFAARRPGSRM